MQFSHQYLSCITYLHSNTLLLKHWMNGHIYASEVTIDSYHLPAVTLFACEATNMGRKKSGYFWMACRVPASLIPSMNWSISALTLRMVMCRAVLFTNWGMSCTVSCAMGLVNPQSTSTSHASIAILRTAASCLASVS